jgi:hypothetical protein
LVVATVAVAAGCTRDEHPNPYRPGSPLYRALDASGARITVRDAGGEIAFKMRRRSDRHKIYDPRDLAPVGWVRHEEEASPKGDASAERPEVLLYVRPLGGEEEHLSSSERAALSRPDRFRIERSGEGLMIFGPSADLLAYLTPSEEGWELRGSYDAASPERVAVRREGVTQIRSGNRLLYESRELGPAAALAVTLEGLDALERGAIGVWLERGGAARRSRAPGAGDSATGDSDG